MCLLVVAHNLHDVYPLVVAGNRDEFHARPTKEAHWWEDEPDIDPDLLNDVDLASPQRAAIR